MKQYFNVAVEVAEGVFSANIAHAESRRDVREYYQNQYPGKMVVISDCAPDDLPVAKRKGMPIVEVRSLSERIEARMQEVYDAKTADHRGTKISANDLVIELPNRMKLVARAEPDANYPRIAIYCVDVQADSVGVESLICFAEHTTEFAGKLSGVAVGAYEEADDECSFYGLALKDKNI